jgi:hypothetical protein
VHVSPRLAAQRVALHEAVLHLDRATQSADDAASLDEAAVAGAVDSQLSRGLRPDPERIGRERSNGADRRKGDVPDRGGGRRSMAEARALNDGLSTDLEPRISIWRGRSRARHGLRPHKLVVPRLLTGVALESPRSFRWILYVSRALNAATAETIVIAKVIAPTLSGMFVDPGGATAAESAGSSAVVVVPIVGAAPSRKPGYASGTARGKSSGKRRYTLGRRHPT